MNFNPDTNTFDKGGTQPVWETILKRIQSEMSTTSDRLKDQAQRKDINYIKNQVMSLIGGLEHILQKNDLIDYDIEYKRKGIFLKEENLNLKEDNFYLKKRLWELEREQERKDRVCERREMHTQTEKVQTLLVDKTTVEKFKCAGEEAGQSIFEYFSRILDDLHELRVKQFDENYYKILIERVKIYQSRARAQCHRLNKPRDSQSSLNSEENEDNFSENLGNDDNEGDHLEQQLKEVDLKGNLKTKLMQNRVSEL